MADEVAEHVTESIMKNGMVCTHAADPLYQEWQEARNRAALNRNRQYESNHRSVQLVIAQLNWGL